MKISQSTDEIQYGKLVEKLMDAEEKLSKIKSNI
jgi:hypothetical protein